MNAAFVLVTTAWLAGADCGSSCGSCCVTSCDPCCARPGLLERLRGLFHRNNCCDACDPCAGAGHATWSSSCGGCTTSCCDPCAERPGLFARLRAWFNRCNDCCDPCGCGGHVISNGHGTVVAAPEAAQPKMEKIEAPKAEIKKMPDGK